MRIAVTGATGTIGRRVVQALLDRDDGVAVLSRDPDRARELLGDKVDAFAWRDPKSRLAPTQAFQSCDAVIHLLGEPLAQRWSDEAKREIRDSRVLGTRNLVDSFREAGPRLQTLVCQSAVGYYGAHGDEVVDETAPQGKGFLADITAAWEAEARRGEEEFGLRVTSTRTGVVLSETGGALEKMLPPFKLGVGGPVAGGRQYIPWIHIEDVVQGMLFCLDEEAAEGPVNLTAPRPATNKALSKTLGKVLHRPAIFPVPGLTLKLLYGEMAEIVTTGQRAVPKRLEEMGYGFRYSELEPALRDAVGRN